MAKYPYIVVKNNTWYPAGTEVPADEPAQTKKEESLVEDKEETPVEELEEVEKAAKTRKK